MLPKCTWEDFLHPLLKRELPFFFNHVMAAIGGTGPGDAVVSVYYDAHKNYAFLEMKTVEEASNAMALDGILYKGVALRVQRPRRYSHTVAAALGPSQPSPHLDLAAVGLTPGSMVAADTKIDKAEKEASKEKSGASEDHESKEVDINYTREEKENLS